MTFLRDFYYLNVASVDDYLSQLQGYSEDEIQVSDQRKNQVKGGAAAVVSFEGGMEHTESMVKKGKVSDANKFNRLYELVADKKYLKSNVNKAKKRDLIELEGVLEIPDLIRQLQLFSNWIPNADEVLADELVPDALKGDQPAYVQSLLSSFTNKMFNFSHIPVKINASNSVDFNLYCILEKEWLLTDLSKLDGLELSIVAKIVKIVPDNQEKVINPNFNFNDLGLDKQKQSELDKSLGDLSMKIFGPAKELKIISIYE